MKYPPTSDDWRPTASLDVLRIRSRALQAVRRFFFDEGYWEVDTPHLSSETVIDAHLDPIMAQITTGSSCRTGYLQTSPEFGMKRLLAAGADRIFQLGHVFRDGEQGDRHNPEFTLLEWYRVGDLLAAQMDFTERFVRHLHRELSSNTTCPLPAAPFERLRYDDAFEGACGTRVLEMSSPELQELARGLGIHLPESLAADDRDGILNLLLAVHVEPWLAKRGAVFLHDYPATQAALARVRHDHPPVAERFELYLDGLELCNGYHELTDAAELAARFARQNEIRRSQGSPELPPDSRLLAALQSGLPDCSGVAVGFDRLLMRLLGKTSISEVIPFPIDRA